MAKRKAARFTLKEIQMLIRVAQEQHTRLVLELKPDGQFRIIFNDDPDAPTVDQRDYVL